MKSRNITIGLDTSFHSTGFAIHIDDTILVGVVGCTPTNPKLHPSKYAVAMCNALNLANKLSLLFTQYRNDNVVIMIESVGYAIRFQNTSSVLDLVTLQGVILNQLSFTLGANITFIMPASHKKAFTGNGKASKELSVIKLLELEPKLVNHFEKLDDIADAVSLLSCSINVHDKPILLY